MARKVLTELQSLLRKLEAERQSHLAALQEIEATLSELGIDPGRSGATRGKRRGRPPGKASGKIGGRRKRRKYATSGTQSILSFISKGNRNGASGAEIAKHWKSENRAGSSYNIINMLLKAGKVRKKKLKGERGSLYMAA